MTTARLPASAGEFVFIMLAVIGAVVVLATIVGSVFSGVAWATSQLAGVSPEAAARYTTALGVGAAVGWTAHVIYTDVRSGSNAQ